MISPVALDRQRATLSGKRKPCPVCRGTRTSGATCQTCYRLGVFDPKRLNDRQLSRYLAALRKEVQRRRDALDAALKEG